MLDECGCVCVAVRESAAKFFGYCVLLRLRLVSYKCKSTGKCWEVRIPSGITVHQMYKQFAGSRFPNKPDHSE